MRWDEIPETNNVVALFVSGDYVISCWQHGFVVTYRPVGEHIALGTFETLERAKFAACEHRIERMTKAEITKEIAELCGWKYDEDSGMVFAPDGSRVGSELIPAYADDLNAMRGAKATLCDSNGWECIHYVQALEHVITRQRGKPSQFGLLTAAPIDEAKAFLLTKRSRN